MQIVKPLGVHADERGRFIEMWQGNEWCEVNFLEIRQGRSRGGHYHRRNRELMVVTSGRCDLRLEKIDTGEVSEYRFQAGEAFVIEPLERHTLTALSDCTLVTLNTLPYSPEAPDVFDD